MTDFRTGHRFSGPALVESFRAIPPPRLAPVYTGRSAQLDRDRVAIRNQAGRGTCVSHAGLACLEYVTRVGPLSVQMADYNARLLHGETGLDAGTFPHTLVTSLIVEGVCSEEIEPYTMDFAIRPREFAYQQGYDRRVLSGHALDGVGSTLDLIERSLRADVPVFGGWTIPRSLFDYDGKSVISSLDGVVAGGHSMAVWGVDASPTGERTWTLRNSWGEEWGDRGYAYVSDAVMGEILDACLFGGPDT